MFRQNALRFTFACVLFVSQANAVTQEDLDASRTKWDQQQLTDYGFRFQRFCFCFGEYTREVIVRVEGNEVIEATDTETHLGFGPTLERISEAILCLPCVLPSWSC